MLPTTPAGAHATSVTGKPSLTRTNVLPTFAGWHPESATVTDPSGEHSIAFLHVRGVNDGSSDLASMDELILSVGLSDASAAAATVAAESIVLLAANLGVA